MTDQAAVDWPTCDEDGCIGIRLGATTKCLAHAPDEQRNATLKQLSETGEINARGVPINQALFEHILAAAPHDTANHPTFATALFDQATFEGEAGFDQATFQGTASFERATFQDIASFGRATFQDIAWFGGATFQAYAVFGGATFQAYAVFEEATFQGNAVFVQATFQGNAVFVQATFQGNAVFEEATFQDVAQFYGATFRATARFDRATFQDATQFYGATFQGNAVFQEATFQDAGFNGATFQDVWFNEATFRDAGFEEATFQDAWFNEATFQDARFNEATFQYAAFSGTTFRAIASFDRATFQDAAWFGGATFQDALFDRATFRATARFDRATFQADAWFGGATFQDALFDRATFRATARFDRATFRATARFDRATFQDAARFGGTIVHRGASFTEATFEQARQLGPLLVYGMLRLDGAHFAELVLIEASSRGLSCQRTRFPAGVQFRLRGAHVVMDDADLSSPSLLTGVNTLSDARLAHRERRLVQAMRRSAPAATAELSARPQLLSVQGANLAGLAVGNIDLARCRFAGAHNLDRLRFEAEVSFAVAPARLPWDWRQVLAEERTWRTARSNRWATGDWWPAWLYEPYSTKWLGVVEPAQIAGLYRALRKAREDAKDEPGAADFYYGEMEMRRHAGRGRTGGASRGRVERAVLTAYWLASGYGLRAWRALTALAVVLIAFAGLLVWDGYQPETASLAAGSAPTTTAPTSPGAATTAPTSPATTVADRSLTGALLYGARTIIGLNPTPAPALTQFGEVLLIAVRVLGPVLLALALLALRGRVRR